MKHNISKSSLIFLLPGICYLAELIIWKSFTQSRAVNGVLGGLWSVGQIGILTILPALYRRNIYNGNKWKATGVVIAGMGAVSYLLNYILGYWLFMNTRLLLPLGALLTGIGMTITGIQILRAHRWQSAFCFMPLAVGLYPFVVMFPLVLITGSPDITAILCWGVPWLLLGLGMIRSDEKWSSSRQSIISAKSVTDIQ